MSDKPILPAYEDETEKHRSIRRRIFNVIEEDHANDKSSIIYDNMMTFVILLSLVPICTNHEHLLFRVTDAIVLLVFIADYILRWFTSDFKLNTFKRIAFARYPFSFLALTDLVAMIPLVIAVFTGAAVTPYVRLLRLLKVFRWIDYSDSFEVIRTVVRQRRKQLRSVLYLTIGYAFVASMIVFQDSREGFTRLFDVFYWIIITMSSVGFGDYSPVTDLGKTVAMFSSVIGVILAAIATAILAAGYMEELKRKRVANEENIE